jgi:uncharacterized protein (UPF0303 family)
MNLFGITSKLILDQEKSLILPSCDLVDAIEIGKIALKVALTRELPITTEVHVGERLAFRVALPGSTSDNDWWITRKSRVVFLKNHSTLYEKVYAEERGVDWHKENNLFEDTHAIHGGGLPLITKSEGFIGALLVSGLPQLDDHLLGVEILTEFLAFKGESL